MSMQRLLSAARPPLPPGKKNATRSSLPWASNPSFRLCPQRTEGTTYGSCKIASHHASKTTRVSRSPPRLSSYATVMPPHYNEVSSQVGSTEVAVACTLVDLQSGVRSHRAGVTVLSNVRGDTVPSKTASCRETGVAGAYASTVSNRSSTSPPQVAIPLVAPIPVITARRTRAIYHELLDAKFGAISHIAGVTKETNSALMSQIEVTSRQVRDIAPASPCKPVDCPLRKRRADLPSTELPAKRACLRVMSCANADYHSSHKSGAFNEFHYRRKIKVHHDDSNEPSRKKRRTSMATPVVTRKRFDSMEVC